MNNTIQQAKPSTVTNAKILLTEDGKLLIRRGKMVHHLYLVML